MLLCLWLIMISSCLLSVEQKGLKYAYKTLILIKVMKLSLACFYVHKLEF
jgi:hypothetical protein